MYNILCIIKKYIIYIYIYIYILVLKKKIQIQLYLQSNQKHQKTYKKKINKNYNSKKEMEK